MHEHFFHMPFLAQFKMLTFFGLILSFHRILCAEIEEDDDKENEVRDLLNFALLSCVCVLFFKFILSVRFVSSPLCFRLVAGCGALFLSFIAPIRFILINS